LALISFPEYQKAKRQHAMERSAVILAQDLRKVQEMAMSSAEVNGSVPAGGYGLYVENTINPGQYILFADFDNDKTYDSGEEFEVINLEGESKVYQINTSGWPNCGTSTCTGLAVIFSPPNPSVAFRLRHNGVWITIADSEVEIILKESGLERKIRVNKAGLIDVE